MDNLREYVVSAEKWEDVESLYDDLTEKRGTDYVPEREVEVAQLRPISRNTHFYLSDEEAEILKNDPRVLAVEVPPSQNPNIKILPCFTQTSSLWDKSTAITSEHKNWGLARVCNGIQTTNWGSDGTTAITQTITVKSEGENVDVVIVDGHFIDHPEFRTNSDGTGTTRVQAYNWFSLNPYVTGGVAGNYTYTYAASAENIHGTHVAGTACGITQGWARKSNIYNIYPYNDTVVSNSLLFDYIRQFHKNKPVNSVTKRKNPTICNNSWGSYYSASLSVITSINVRGVSTAVTSATANATLTSKGLKGRLTVETFSGSGVFVTYAAFGNRVAAIDLDIADAIADGVIVVGAAGNYDETIARPGEADYNNYITVSGSADPIYYMRGSSPSSTLGVITVGAVDTTKVEQKASYSSAGSRIDVFAPGTNILSSIPSGFWYTGEPFAADPNNSSYRIAKQNGTSMASPQVTGVLACALQLYPTMNQDMALKYITSYAGQNQLATAGGLVTDYAITNGLRTAPNRYLKFVNERKDTGAVFPKRSSWFRKTSGFVYPRTGNKSVKVWA